MKGTVYRYLRYGGCAALGIVFFWEPRQWIQARLDKDKRNPWGQRDAVYKFYAEGLEGAVDLTVTVPSRRLSPEEFHERMPDARRSSCPVSWEAMCLWTRSAQIWSLREDFRDMGSRWHGNRRGRSF